MVSLESEGNYVRVVEEGDAEAGHHARHAAGLACAVLDPEQFVRVSRFAILNLSFVERIERDADSHLVFVMRDGRSIRRGPRLCRRCSAHAAHGMNDQPGVTKRCVLAGDATGRHDPPASAMRANDVQQSRASYSAIRRQS